jgi:DNA mismatch repair protein MutL
MSVVNRIAAGEVVERPASIVKELLENALDAGPTRIDVTLEQGGVALVRVVDDGCGMEPDDLPLAVAPHATSKLRVAEDLERIGTLGFRGEALASIGEVSRLVIRSRPAGGAGATLEVDGGRMGEVVPEGCAVGTTVDVRQVFGNVPARRAFLRAPQTEWSHAAEAFVRTALAHPGVAFTLTHNGRLVHDLPTVTAWRERIGGLFGTKMAERLIELEASDGEIRLAGLVGRPADDQASGRLQHLFVAGRPFRDRSILRARGLSGAAPHRPAADHLSAVRIAPGCGRRQRPPCQDGGAVSGSAAALPTGALIVAVEISRKRHGHIAAASGSVGCPACRAGDLPSTVRERCLSAPGGGGSGGPAGRGGSDDHRPSARHLIASRDNVAAHGGRGAPSR